jgi:hypothetical protein
MSPIISRASLVALLLFASTLQSSLAQESGAAPARQACTAPEHRQFDFWVGEWDVTTPAGKPAGGNRIESILGGCALRETWSGAGGSRGTSYSAWDRQRRRWHQTWIDDGGLVLRLEGGFADGKMVLQGETLDSAEAAVLNRITWQETGPGAVRQLWEVSSDGGKTWGVAFDGRYRKR